MSQNENEPRRPTVTQKVDRPARTAAYLSVAVRHPIFGRLLKTDAHLVDLSPEGLKLTFGRDLKAKAGDTFVVELPQTGAGATAIFTLRVTCRWYDKGEFALGGQFGKLSSEQQILITTLVDELRRSGRLVS